MSESPFSRNISKYAFPRTHSLQNNNLKYITPEKIRYPRFDNKSPERFGGLLKTLSKSRDEQRIYSRTPMINSADQFNIRANIKKPEFSYRKSFFTKQSSGPPERYWKGLYYGKSASKEFKRKYDFYNRSPITWMNSQDTKLKVNVPNQSYSMHLMEYQNLDKHIRRRLNSVRIAKGMGYKKTNIFFH